MYDYYIYIDYIYIFTGLVRDASHKINELKPELMNSGLDISKLTSVSLNMHTHEH